MGTRQSVPNSEHVSALNRALKEASREGLEPTSSPGEDYDAWLRITRDRIGLTRKELAARAGVSQVQILNIETGRTTRPRDTTRAQLETALNQTPPAELVEAVEESSQIAGVGRISSECAEFSPTK